MYKKESIQLKYGQISFRYPFITNYVNISIYKKLNKTKYAKKR